MTIKSDSFCVNPWYQIRINPDASVSHCNRAVDESYPLATDNFVTEFQRNSGLVNARDHYANSNPGVMKNCVRCFAEESSGLDTYRIKQNVMAFIHPDKFHESLAQSDVLGRINQGVALPKYVFVKFSNDCDLTCRMCSVQASSSINELYQTHLPDRYRPEFKTHWPSDTKLWESFLDLTLRNDQLDILQINGGEPLSDPSFWKFLRVMVSHGKTDIKLIVTTNCVQYHPELVELLSEFQHVVLDMSVETFTEVNDYIRYPSNHQMIKQHMESYVQALRSDQVFFSIHITPQAYSMADLYTVLDYANENQLGITCNKVWPQRHLDPVILPHDHKTALVKFYSDRYFGASASVKTAVNRIIHWLSAPEPADISSLRTQFVSETQLHDRLLGTDFLSVFPQYAEFYQEYCE